MEEYGHFIQQPLGNATLNHNLIKNLARYKTITLESCLNEIHGSEIWFITNLKLIISTPNKVRFLKGLI